MNCWERTAVSDVSREVILHTIVCETIIIETSTLVSKRTYWDTVLRFWFRMLPTIVITYPAATASSPTAASAWLYSNKDDDTTTTTTTILLLYRMHNFTAVFLFSVPNYCLSPWAFYVYNNNLLLRWIYIVAIKHVSAYTSALLFTCLTFRELLFYCQLICSHELNMFKPSHQHHCNHNHDH